MDSNVVLHSQIWSKVHPQYSYRKPETINFGVIPIYFHQGKKRECGKIHLYWNFPVGLSQNVQRL